MLTLLEDWAGSAVVWLSANLGAIEIDSDSEKTRRAWEETAWNSESLRAHAVVLNSESRPCGACRAWSSHTVLLNRWLCRPEPNQA